MGLVGVARSAASKCIGYHDQHGCSRFSHMSNNQNHRYTINAIPRVLSRMSPLFRLCFLNIFTIIYSATAENCSIFSPTFANTKTFSKLLHQGRVHLVLGAIQLASSYMLSG